MSATAAATRAQSTRESFGGKWTTSFTVFGVLFFPALALTAYQDIGEAYPSLLDGAIACIVPCASVAVVFVIAKLARRTTVTIPIVLCLLFWAIVGITHGVVAAFLAAALTHSEPHYVAQVVYWGATSLIWLPLVTYATAQLANRRELLASLQQETRRDKFLRRSSLLEIADLRSNIVTAIRNNIRPVLLEIEHSLETIGPSLDGARFSEIGRQLSDVSEETTRIIETTVGEPAVLPPVGGAGASTPAIAALDFHRDRPLMAALLTSVALLPLLVAVSFRSESLNPAGLESAALILLLITALIAAGLFAQRYTRHLPWRARTRIAVAAYLLAGISAAVLSIVGPWQPESHQNLALTLLLPIAVPMAAATLSAAVGLGNVNLEIESEIAEVEDRIADFEASLEVNRTEIRSQVSALTHGPLRGRLAACAMALNFHAAEIETSPPERTEYITASVREHLSSALAELDSLG